MIKNKHQRLYIPVRGGLGNQMFFYAFSLYLKNIGFIPLFVWFEYLFTKQHNGVELLDVFDIEVEHLDKKKISFFLWINNIPMPFLFRRIMRRIFLCRYLFVKKFKQKTPYSFEDLSQLPSNNNILMDGFWQNFKYLTEIRVQLLNSFKFKLPTTFNDEAYLNKILSSNSVSIHIRRGDYFDPRFADLNVIKTTDYYLNAIAYLKKQHRDLVFFIFTDDVKWAKENFKSEAFIFVEGHENNEAFIDMYLMSHCKHNIIANSTFSWWGAWLNESPNKVVIAPELWSKGISSTEICPQNWIFFKV